MVMTSRVLRASVIALASLTASTLAACSAGGGPGEGTEAQSTLGASELRIVSVSTRPHLVTGGDVLLRIDLGTDVDESRLQQRFFTIRCEAEIRCSSFRLI